jgi:hypothetical protein
MIPAMPTPPSEHHALKRLAVIEAQRAALRAEGSELVTRAQKAGLRIENVARPSPGKRAHRDRLDATLRWALAQMASGQPTRQRRAGPRRWRPKN